MEIDVTLVACRRPDLLSRTLASFQERVFTNFRIRSAVCNIDPAMGSEDDARECIGIVRSHFDDPMIFTPEEASFGHAVKRVWERVEAPIALHMEDDWEALEPICPADVESLFARGAASVSPAAIQHKVKPGTRFLTRRVRSRFLPLPGIRVKVSDFSTSPMFLRRDFLKTYIRLMDPGADPEKQCRPGFNDALFRHASSHRHALMWGAQDTPLIEDIGRNWREERAIRKEVRDGVSVWTQDS